MYTRAARTASGFTQPVPLSYTETAMFVQMQYSKACSICLLALLVPALMVPWSGTAAPGEALRLAVTTSTDDSGLLAVLRPVFEAAAGYSLRVVVTGSGKALRLGRDGEVDMLIVHSPVAEQAFMEEGWGERRTKVMHNDFVLLGPPGPEQPDILEWLRELVATGTGFVSRGDHSGTHVRELALWQQAGVEPGSGYLSVGQGMAAALRIADEKQAWILSDRGTWLALQDTLDLQIRSQGSSLLRNIYHVITVNPERHPHVNFVGARDFVEFVTGPQGQRLIDGFRVRGQHLFYPAEPPDMD